jgi:hypothetical protein
LCGHLNLQRAAGYGLKITSESENCQFRFFEKKPISTPGQELAVLWPVI